MECVACGNNDFKRIDDNYFECQTCGSRFTIEELQEYSNDRTTPTDEEDITYFENELLGEENLARFSSSLNISKKKNSFGVKLFIILVFISITSVILWSTLGIKHLAKKEYSFDINNLNVGDIFYFGKYEQDANSQNGTEKILWEVIAEEDDRLLLLSSYSLDAKEYGYWSKEYVLWENSYEREWLNNEFYDSAFDKYQKCLIKKISLVNKDNSKYSTDGGSNTTDKVFLLSEEEFEKYITGNIGIGINTEYTSRQGLGGKPANRVTIWRLRTPGKDNKYVSFVDASGKIDIEGVGISEKLPIRPAIWISKN